MNPTDKDIGALCRQHKMFCTDGNHHTHNFSFEEQRVVFFGHHSFLAESWSCFNCNWQGTVMKALPKTNASTKKGRRSYASVS